MNLKRHGTVTLSRVCNNDRIKGNHGYQTVMGHLWATGLSEEARMSLVSKHWWDCMSGYNINAVCSPLCRPIWLQFSVIMPLVKINK